MPAVRDEVEPREARRAAERMGKPEILLTMDVDDKVFIWKEIGVSSRSWNGSEGWGEGGLF